MQHRVLCGLKLPHVCQSTQVKQSITLQSPEPTICHTAAKIWDSGVKHPNEVLNSCQDHPEPSFASTKPNIGPSSHCARSRSSASRLCSEHR